MRTNSEADDKLLDRVATPDELDRKLLADASAAMRCRRAGSTACFALPGPSPISPGPSRSGRIHVAEALSYRRKAPRN